MSIIVELMLEFLFYIYKLSYFLDFVILEKLVYYRFYEAKLYDIMYQLIIDWSP